MRSVLVSDTSQVESLAHLDDDMLLLPNGTYNDSSAMFLRRPVMKWCKEHLRQFKAGRERVTMTCTAKAKMRKMWSWPGYEVGDQWQGSLNLPVIRFDHAGDLILFKLMWGGE